MNAQQYFEVFLEDKENRESYNDFLLSNPESDMLFKNALVNWAKKENILPVFVSDILDIVYNNQK